MNKDQILKLISPYVQKTFDCSESLELDDVTCNLQESKTTQIVFYRITGAPGSEEKFLERLKNSNYGLLIVNRTPLNFEGKNVVQVEDNSFFEAQKVILDDFYPVKRNTKLIGITGTNGKTTVVNLAQQIACLMGHRSISIGTLGISSSGEVLNPDIGATTPSFIDVRKIIFEYQNDFEAMFFEVSSHGLAQKRLYDLKLDVAAWTNFSQDHLDYHKDMENYFLAKTLIYKEFLKEGAPLIIPWREKELRKKIEDFESGKLNFNLRESKKICERGFENLPSFYRPAYNQSNLEIALEVNEELWGGTALLDLQKVEPPKGRFSLIEIEEDNKLVVIDYAHTPDALENVLKSIKESFDDYSVSVVFGCGGDRDSSKRKIMGEKVSLYADKIFVTSDNPRSEDPQKIIDEISTGISSRNLFTTVGRKDAILWAMDLMQDKEVLLIAGKGHEEYQEIGEEIHHFSDFEVVNFFKDIN